MRPRVIYPGTFDPVTYGHLDILARALEIFGKVEVVVAENRQKNPLFTLEERRELIRASVRGKPGITVSVCRGLLADYVKRSSRTVFIRGLRAVSDFEYELQLAVTNRKLNRAIETVFLTPNDRFIFLSSSMVRDIVRLGGNITDFVPPVVRAALRKKFRP